MTDRIGDILVMLAKGEHLNPRQMMLLQTWGNSAQINNALVSEWNKTGTRYIDERKIWRAADSSASPVSPDEETLEITAETGDGHVTGSNVVYAVARATSTGFASGGSSNAIGQDNNSGTRQLWRVYLSFDTSVLGATATILSARLKMQVSNMGPTRGVPSRDKVDNDYDIQIVQYDWSASDPVDAGNRETVYDGILAASTDVVWKNTQSISEGGTYSGGLLDTTYIDQTGTTYYGLRSSLDFDSNGPANDEIEKVEFVSADAGAGVKPTLVIQYIP